MSDVSALGATTTFTDGTTTVTLPSTPGSLQALADQINDTTNSGGVALLFSASVNAGSDGLTFNYNASGAVSVAPSGVNTAGATITNPTLGVTAVTDVNGGAAYSSAAQMLTEITQATGYDSFDYTVQLDSTGSKLVFDAKTTGVKTVSNVPTFSQSVSTNSARTEIQQGVTGVIDPESVNRSTGPQRVGFFTVVEDFMEALLANDGDGARRALKEVSQVTDNLSLSMANVGGRMGEVQSQFDVLSDTKIRYSAMLSQEEDLDYAKAVSDLTAEMLSLEAGQATFAKISQMNLFDYIR